MTHDYLEFTPIIILTPANDIKDFQACPIIENRHQQLMQIEALTKHPEEIRTARIMQEYFNDYAGDLRENNEN